MSRMRSVWETFEFSANIREPFVWRPIRVPRPLQVLFGLAKIIGKTPTRFFRSHLSLDCNERIVEYPFVWESLGPVLGKTILDFGCTESVLSPALATLGARVVGVDLRGYDFPHPNLEFHMGDFLENRLPSESFDAIVAVSAVEHCGLDAYGSKPDATGDTKVLAEFRRLLRSGGTLVLTVPFGVRRLAPGQRIYDSAQLNELIGEFDVVVRRFYRKGAQQSWWMACTEQEAAGVGYDPIAGVQGVALLKCRKPESVGSSSQQERGRSC